MTISNDQKNYHFNNVLFIAQNLKEHVLHITQLHIVEVNEQCHFSSLMQEAKFSFQPICPLNITLFR